jgi:hypothetical protein
MPATQRSYPPPTAEAITALAAQDLPEAVDLVEAVTAGHDDAERCTANDVVTRPGYVRWATPLRYLGDLYVPKAWKRERPSCYELLISPDGKRAITVAQGDSATGTERMPSTLLDRGPLTRQAVEGNMNQLRFPVEVHPDFAPDEIPGMKIWMLLSYFDRAANQIRSELSVPVEFTRSPGALGDKRRGHVTKFSPRIILPTITLTASASIADEETASEPIDVPVTRRK